MKTLFASISSTPVSAGTYKVRAFAAVVLLATASLAPAANPWRFLQESTGDDPSTLLDDELIATRIAWDLEDRAGAENQVPVTAAVTQGTVDEIVPQQNNQFGTLRQGDVRTALNNSLAEWNRANAGFRYRETVLLNTMFPYEDGTFPETVALDRVNLISFQDPLNPLGGEGGVLAVASVFYFNEDIDLSQNGSFPINSVEVSFEDGFINLNGDIRAMLRLESRLYKAGTIIDSDITFNQSNPQWDLPPFDEDSVPPQDRPLYFGALDIQAIATHELGHAAGIGHTELLLPTMTPVLDFDTDPYQMRSLDFDDLVALRMAYRPLFDRLDRGAISGRLINGDAVDGVDPLPPLIVSEVQNAPVFLGRINNDGPIVGKDQLLAIDEDTSFTNKVQLFYQVLTGQEFRTPDSFSLLADTFRDNRFFFGGLPSSLEELEVNERTIIAPGDYVAYVRSGTAAIDEPQLFFPPEIFVPEEFYGGARSWFQAGMSNVPDPNTPGDFLVQNTSLQFGFSRQGQFSLRLPGSTYQLVDNRVLPATQSYLTYRIISENGVTTDVTNIDFGSTVALGGMIEDDVNNRAEGTFRLADSIVTTQTLQLGQYRGAFFGPQSDFLVQVQAQNVTSSPIQVGLRALVRPVLNRNTQVRFHANGQEYKQETTLLGAEIPPVFTWSEDSFPTIQGVATVANPGVITAPDKLQFANYFNINQIGRGTSGVYFDYPTNNTFLTDAAYAVTFNPRTIQPGEIITMNTNIGFSFEREYIDGPVGGPVDPPNEFPGEDDPNVYKLINVVSNTVTGGIDILTNTGTPGGLSSLPGDDDPITTSAADQDGDDIPNEIDNCVDFFNPGQDDLDGDFIGDACDQDSMTFTDVSPVAPASPDNPRNALPFQALQTYGAAVGDLDNDGYPDLALANGAIAQDQPQSLLNRVYMNIPAPTASDPGARRFIDQTFGRDGVVGSIDDRLPRDPDDIFASFDVKLADFDNDGDLDMFVAVFATGGSSAFLLGGQNRFYENIDVDDIAINPSPDADNIGDGFFRDVTRLWDPGILNTGAFTPYPNTLPKSVYGIGLLTAGFDISTHSAVGDLDGDGDIDVVVSNQNCFMDLGVTNGFNQAERIDDVPRPILGGLRFSERVLINHTVAPITTPFAKPAGLITRFADETLGADGLFGRQVDRMPPLKPEWNTVTPSPPGPARDNIREVDFSNTMAVKLGHFFGSTALGKAGLSIIAFDQRGGRATLGNSDVEPSGAWDGDEIIYVNEDLDFDGLIDGGFNVYQYGFDPSWLTIGIGTGDTLRIGIPAGLPRPPGETFADPNFKEVDDSQSQFGVVMDNDFSGWNELFSFNTVGDHTYYTNRNFTNHQEFNRGRTVFGTNTRHAALDYETVGFIVSRNDTLTLPRFGRTRAAFTEDLNLDGFPDLYAAQDTNALIDITASNQAPGFQSFYINNDLLGFDQWLSLNAAQTSGIITNEQPQSASFAVVSDYDLDGDMDIVSFNYGQPANLYRNNMRTGGVAATVTDRTGINPASDIDVPLFIDQTYKYLAPYLGRGADISNPVPGFQANITLGVDLADINRNGRLDMVFANGGIGTVLGEIQLLLKNSGPQTNDGAKVFTPPVQPLSYPAQYSSGQNPAFLTNDPSPAYDVRFFDANGDGSPDILFTNNGTPPRMFMNVDVDNFAPGARTNFGADQDSVPDGIFEEQADRIIYSEPVFSQRYFSRRMAIGDVNGDGQPDVVVANGSDDGAPNVLFLNERGGIHNGWGYFREATDTKLPTMDYVNSVGEVTGQGPVLDNTYDVALVDIDNDGDLDIVFVNSTATDGLPHDNLWESCRLLINNLSETNSDTFTFTDVADVGSTYSARLASFVANDGRWPLSNRPIAGRGLVVGDFTNQGEQIAGKNYPPGGTEDKNGNGILEDTEDLNGNGLLDFDDVNGSGRHDGNYDLVIVTLDVQTSNIMLTNRAPDLAGNATPGYFADETELRFGNMPKYPTYGGDAGDVNQDGVLDLILAVDLQSLETSGGLTSRLRTPAQLFINRENGDGEAGFMTLVSDAESRVPQGELPVLKTQRAQNMYAEFPGNCRQVKLADVDGDGDLDLIICQAGKVSGAAPYGGWANHVLINMVNPVNMNASTALSLRDPSGPVLNTLAPASAAQGQRLIVTITGKNFAGTPLVDFGAGVVAQSPAHVVDSNTIKISILVSPDAQLGSRPVKVINPDSQFDFSTTSFKVLPSSMLPDTAVEGDWALYYE